MQEVPLSYRFVGSGGRCGGNSALWCWMMPLQFNLSAAEAFKRFTQSFTDCTDNVKSLILKLYNKIIILQLSLSLVKIWHHSRFLILIEWITNAFVHRNKTVRNMEWLCQRHLGSWKTISGRYINNTDGQRKANRSWKEQGILWQKHKRSHI